MIAAYVRDARVHRWQHESHLFIANNVKKAREFLKNHYSRFVPTSRKIDNLRDGMYRLDQEIPIGVCARNDQGCSRLPEKKIDKPNSAERQWNRTSKTGKIKIEILNYR